MIILKKKKKGKIQKFLIKSHRYPKSITQHNQQRCRREADNRKVPSLNNYLWNIWISYIEKTELISLYDSHPSNTVL